MSTFYTFLERPHFTLLENIFTSLKLIFVLELFNLKVGEKVENGEHSQKWTVFRKGIYRHLIKLKMVPIDRGAQITPRHQVSSQYLHRKYDFQISLKLASSI